MASAVDQTMQNAMRTHMAYGGAVSGRTGSAGRPAGKIKLNVSNSAYRAIALGLIAAVVVFALISFSAYAARLQHDNNALEARISNLEADIDSLENEIASGSNVSRIEQTATKKLGMVYPTSTNCINLDNRKTEDTSTGLAASIKNEAYK